MSTPPHQESPEDQNHNLWHALGLLALVVVSIVWVIGLLAGNLLLAALCNIAQIIVGLIAIDSVREFLKKGWTTFLYLLRKFLAYILKNLKIPFFFSWKTKRRVGVGLFVKRVGIGLFVLLTIGLIVWVIQPLLHPQPPLQPGSFDPISTQDGDIGISEGGTAFDRDRIDYQFKSQAAEAYRRKDSGRAKAYWDLAIREDQTDAEAAIYRENLLVQASNRPYITVMVLISLSGDSRAVLTGRDTLQGAHIAQVEYNGGLATHSNLPGRNDFDHKLPNNYLLRLIIANVGTSSPTDTRVAQRIIQEWNKDKTIVGVIGQFTNQEGVVQELKTAKIPMISSTQLAGDIVGTPYLLSVAPSPEQEGKAAADYACSITHDHIAIFYDPSDPYSDQLKQAFDNKLTSCESSIIHRKPYTLGDRQTLKELLNQVYSSDNDLDLIYLPGSYLRDAVGLLPKGSHAQILGNNAFYQFVHDTKPSKDFAGISYTAFAFHDEWRLSNEWNLPQEPWLLRDYPAIFNAQKQHQHTLYSVQIPDADAILAYDATDVLTRMSGEFLKNEQSDITHHFDALWEKLKTIDNFQGFSGCLSFDSNGQPLLTSS